MPFKKGHDGYKYWLGKKMPEEVRLKMSISQKGRKAWNKGKKTGPLKESHRRKIGNSNIGKNSGKNSHWWRGGVTKLAELIKKSYKYRQWRSDVFTRDDFTCQECEKRGIEIHPHHINPFHVIIKENNISCLPDALVCEELWNINNGKTLCSDCHKKTDSYAKRSEQQLNRRKKDVRNTRV